MYKAFLSHSPEDKELAIEIKKAIEDKIHWKAYAYEYDLQPGKELTDKLVRAVLDCDVFIVLIMRERTDSSWIKIETGIAVGKGEKTIPLVLRGLKNHDLPVLQGIEYIQIEPKQREEAISQLLQSLREFENANARYSGGRFIETRPIFDQKVPEESTRKKVQYETDLCRRYCAENLVEWNGARYPISVMIVGPFEENQVDERFMMDSSGKSIVRYTPPQVIYDWNREQAFLTFMKNHPVVRRGEEPYERGEKLYDEHMPRLVKCKLANNKLSLWFQESTFFDYIMTNLALDVRLESENKTLRDILESPQKDRLEPLDWTGCANGFGIGCLVKTNDDKYVLVSRSVRVTGAKLSYAPSAGGIMKLLPDRRDDRSPSVFRAARRQLWEEMHIDYRDTIKRIQLLGITRDLERGGYPDGHFYVEVSLNHEEVKREFDSAEHRREANNQSFESPENLANYTHDEGSSSALRGCLYLLQKVKHGYYY